MKRFGIWLLIGLMLISLLSCSLPPEKEVQAVADTFVQSEPEKPINGPDDLRAGEQPDFEGAVLDWIDDEKVIRFPDQDYSQWKSFNDCMSGDRMVDIKYSDLMQFIGEDGLIVAARAHGDRIGHPNSRYTWTKVKIEKVFYGTAPSNEIRVQEDYSPVMENGKNYIIYTSDYSRLKDDELVLLFLSNLGPEIEGYRVVYYQIPLQEGYQNYSEEYLTELLDFYRGNSQVYKQKKQENKEPELTVEGNEYNLIISDMGDSWPKKNLSNKEMLEELSDNILVQVAANHKVCLWPSGHAKFQYIKSNDPAKNFYWRWSNPPRNY